MISDNQNDKICGDCRHSWVDHVRVKFIFKEYEEDVSVNLEEEKKKKGLESNSDLLKYESIEDIIRYIDELEKCAQKIDENNQYLQMNAAKAKKYTLCESLKELHNEIM